MLCEASAAQTVEQLTTVARAIQITPRLTAPLGAPFAGKGLEFDVALDLPDGVAVPFLLGGIVADVEYRLLKHNGSPTTEFSWVSAPPSSAVPFLTTPIAPASIRFKPLFVERLQNLPAAGRQVGARVRLRKSLPPVAGDWADLAPIPLPVPVAPVPTILVFFTEENYKEHKLVVVPQESPISGADNPDGVEDALIELTDALNALGGSVSNLTWILGKLGLLPGKIAEDPAKALVVRKLDEHPNLNEIDLRTRIIILNDTEAEDETESMILIGPPGREVRLYNERNHTNGEGQLRVWTNDRLYVEIESLAPDAGPDTDPNGLSHVQHTPRGHRRRGCCFFQGINDFTNEISSFRFSQH